MGIIDKILGHHEEPNRESQPQQPAANQAAPSQATNAPPTDEQAIARYRYMLKTAPPEAIEQAHQEAFAALTPEQRRTALQQLSSAVPEWERPAPGTPAEDPQALARMATRVEMRQPGILERLFGGAPGMGGGPGMGALMGRSFLTSIAGGFVASLIAQHFFNNTVAGQSFLGGGPAPVAAAGDDQDVGSDSDDSNEQDSEEDSDSADYENSDTNADDSGIEV